MDFIPHMELYPNYEDGLFDNYDGTQKIATNSFLKDGNILYLMGGTVLCKYNISDSEDPRLLNRADIAAVFYLTRSVYTYYVRSVSFFAVK